MFYLLSNNHFPLEHVSSGKLVHQNHFVHSRRNLDSFVLLVGIKGTLYIAQDDKKYELGPNQFLLLFSGHTHYGYQPSGEDLAYYWCHFRVKGNQYQVCTEEEIDQNQLSDYYVVPEYGSFGEGDRIHLGFRQVLDLAHTQFYSNYLANYALSLMAMEISQDYFTRKEEQRMGGQHRISEIMEWIRINYREDLTVQKVAERFNYNPSYLSERFKAQTGLPLLRYINHTKLSMAKQLLLNSDFSVGEISQQSGFHDEKNFMKLFKREIGLTPTQYRNAFYRTKLNQE